MENATRNDNFAKSPGEGEGEEDVERRSGGKRGGDSLPTEEQICKQVMESCEYKRIVVVGDFNFLSIHWDSLSARSLDGAEFDRCIQEDFLKQDVDSPTGEGAILDLVLGMSLTRQKDMDNGKFREGYVDTLGHVDIEKEVEMGVLKNIKLDRFPRPDGIYPRILRKTKEEVMIDEDRAVCKDFTKTFDRVPHGRLVQKIKSHGIH
eukprot:g47798.t1